MSDYWDHPEYGLLEEKFEKQVTITRKWMALHDGAVDALELAQAENKRIEDAGNHLLKAGCNKDNQIFEYLKHIEQLEVALGDVFALVDEGKLVRKVGRDECAAFVQRLKKAKSALPVGDRGND